ncbi:MAG: GNAT family N-acetyltransferase [Solirubrobacteraceae bacterium]
MTRIVLPAEALIDGSTVLRPWGDSDVDALVVVGQDPELARWTSVPMPYDEARARAYLSQRDHAVQAGASAPFAIVSPDGELLGQVSLLRPVWKHARAEVGYWLAPQARGHGHATRAVRMICTWGFTALSLERIDLFAATGNLASQRVAERAGFTREAVLRSYMRGRHERQDMVAFGLLIGPSAARRSG